MASCGRIRSPRADRPGSSRGPGCPPGAPPSGRPTAGCRLRHGGPQAQPPGPCAHLCRFDWLVPPALPLGAGRGRRGHSAACGAVIALGRNIVSISHTTTSDPAGRRGGQGGLCNPGPLKPSARRNVESRPSDGQRRGPGQFPRRRSFWEPLSGGCWQGRWDLCQRNRTPLKNKSP